MNVLFIMSDQHNFRCTGYAGHPMVQTPTLDALAASGVVFNQMFTCQPTCAPSRVSFFTGMYPLAHNQYGNVGDLRRPLPSVLTELKKAGYTTLQFGKNHLPPAISKDFDEMWTMDTYRRYLKKRGLSEKPVTPELLKNFTSSTSALPEEEQNEVWTANRVIDFLTSSRAKRNPFFIWCSFDRPHPPLLVPASLDSLYNPDDVPTDWQAYERFEQSRLQNRPMVEDFWKLGAVRHDVSIFQKALCRYFALITLIDREIGRVLVALRDAGLVDDTLVIYTSDHGDWAGRYGQIGKNLPGYDELLRIPFIYLDPKRPHDGGGAVEGAYQNVDLFPSILERLGLPCPPSVQGISFLPALDGRPGSGREYVFAETSMEKTIRSMQWKLTFFVRHPAKGQLFRLSPNADETDNLWDNPAYGHIQMRLLQELMAWMVRCEQPPGMDSSWEEYIDTAWYRWLSQQPDQVEIPGRQPTNEK